MCVCIYIYFHILAYIFDIVRLGSNNVTCVLIPSYSFWKFNLVNNNNNITIYRLRYNFKSLFQILRFISWLSSLVDISYIIILHRKLFYYVCDLLCLTVNQLSWLFLQTITCYTGTTANFCGDEDNDLYIFFKERGYTSTNNARFTLQVYAQRVDST